MDLVINEEDILFKNQRQISDVLSLPKVTSAKDQITFIPFLGIEVLKIT